MDAIDINEEALKLAKKNSISLNAKSINYIKMNILKEIPKNKYDIVISNPPYISKEEYSLLDGSIKNHEPLKALTDLSHTILLKNISKIITIEGVEVTDPTQIKEFVEILNNPTLEALGDKPGSTKPYCYIDDLIDGLLLLAMKDITGEYNICPDDQINIEEVAKAVMSGLEVYKEIEWLGESANWKGDNRIISVSNSKMKSIGWSPKYSSKQAIIKAVKDIPNE